MHVLTVLDHPDPAAFSAAVAHEFMEGARFAGHTVELADLHAEGFDPRWTMKDIQQDSGLTQSPDISREQERIACADAICMVFPLFWWGMPSMTKGWVDRVWTWGWAYGQLDNPDQSLQRNRSGVLLIPAGAQSDEMAERGYLKAIETAWMDGTFGYVGFSPRKMEVLNGSTGSLSRRQDLLKRSYQIGQTIAPPDPAV